MLECIYNPIMAIGFSAMFTFKLDNTKKQSKSLMAGQQRSTMYHFHQGNPIPTHMIHALPACGSGQQNVPKGTKQQIGMMCTVQVFGTCSELNLSPFPTLLVKLTFFNVLTWLNIISYA